MKTVRISLPFVFCLLAFGVSSYLSLADGFHQGHDWLFEMVRSAQFKAALEMGQRIPYWAPDLFHGHGSPIFLFYAPLFAALTAWLQGLTGVWLEAFGLALTLLTALGGLGIYLLASELTGEPAHKGMAGRVSLYLYLLAPYLLADKWLRNANAEFAGLALVPFLLLGVLLLRRRSGIGFLVTAISMAAVILAHNLTALWAFACAISLVCAIALQGRSVLFALRGMGALFCGLGMAAFFWLPALHYRALVSPEVMVSGKFDFHNQFQPLNAYLGYEAFFSMGYLLPALAAGVTIYLVKEMRTRIDAINLALALWLLSSLFLLFPVSTPLWETLPFLSLFQFPWRFVGPFSLFAAILGGMVITQAARKSGEATRWGLEVSVLVLAVLSALPMIRAAQPLPEPIQARIEQYLEPGSIASSGARATVMNEYLPKGASLRPAGAAGVQGVLLHDSNRLSLIYYQESGMGLVAELHAEGEAMIDFPKWSFPVWQVAIDGVESVSHKGSYGTLRISVPPGKHVVSATVRPPELRETLYPVSLFFLLLTLALPLRGAWRSWARTK
jgi:hypothetical protein